MAKNTVENADINVAEDVVCMVNNKEADMDTKVYENFEVIWKLLEKPSEDWFDDEDEAYDSVMEETEVKELEDSANAVQDSEASNTAGSVLKSAEISNVSMVKNAETVKSESGEEISEEPPKPAGPISIYVMVNGKPVAMSGKPRYVFVDVFNFINFDLSKPQGAIVTKVNGHDANYMEELHDKDIIEIYWRKQ